MSQEFNEEINKEMIQNGVVLGHKKSKTHPHMRQYVCGNKNDLEILDSAASWKSICDAGEFLKTISDKGDEIIFFVGTTPAGKQPIQKIADEFSFPFVNTRWLGGTLTNFSVIKGRITYYEDLREKKAKGELSKYTKKEQREFAEQIAKMSENFDGLIHLKKLPKALVVVDAGAHDIVIKEAKKLSIPVVALLDTNDDPAIVEFPVIVNDHSKQSVGWVLEILKGYISKK